MNVRMPIDRKLDPIKRRRMRLAERKLQEAQRQLARTERSILYWSSGPNFPIAGYSPPSYFRGFPLTLAHPSGTSFSVGSKSGQYSLLLSIKQKSSREGLLPVRAFGFASS